MSPVIAIGLLFAILVGVTAWKTAKVVPEQSAFIIERLGGYHRTLDAGLNFLIPFIDKVAYKLSLKEDAIDIPEQMCITKDNVMVGVDGVIYIKLLEPRLAAYEISDYYFAVIQLTQTTLRSEIGKIELDKTFEARQHINSSVVEEVDKASEAWGVKVLRYEIRNINPPRDIISAMEKQMRAEREKRAAILESEGARDSKINVAEGDKQAFIKNSEAKMLAQMNSAKGEAQAILQVAEATAHGLKVVSEQLQSEGGRRAMEMRLAEQYIPEFGKIAQMGNTIVVPANLTDLGSALTVARNLLKEPEQMYVANQPDPVKPHKWGV